MRAQRTVRWYATSAHSFSIVSGILPARQKTVLRPNTKHVWRKNTDQVPRSGAFFMTLSLGSMLSPYAYPSS